MLVKQQAAAYIEARELIVQGAIDTVKDAAFQMSGELKEEYRQQLVVNLLTVLSGNSHVQPTIKL